MTTAKLKGTAYRKPEFIFKQRHPYRWKFHQFIKRILKPLGINAKFNYSHK